MSKTTDDLRERTLIVEGPTGPISEPTPPARSRRINATVDDAGLNVIDRAVMLWLAKKALMEPDSPALYGQALVHFAKSYIQGEFAKGGAS